MTEIVMATQNKGKVHEVKHLLQRDDITLLSLQDVHLAKFEVDESSTTYEGNAWLKAKTIGDKTRYPTLADDSGIEVRALGNAPGVYSARYAKGSDVDRCTKLLRELEGKTDRSAKFVCVLVYYDPVINQKKVFRGEVHGVITQEMLGASGFGYDPVFLPVGYHETMAQLGSDVKNTISHRAKAVQEFRLWWEHTHG